MAETHPRNNILQQPSDIFWDQLNQSTATPGTDCNICLETMEGSVVSHKQCSLIACSDCLITWLKEQERCPMCRRHLKQKSRKYMTVDELVHDIQETRGQRPQPQTYYVVDSVATIRHVLEIVHQMGPIEDFWDFARDEQEDSFQLLESEGISGLTTLSVEELLRRKEEYHLDDTGIADLWSASRVFGVRVFHLMQFERYPDLGFWTALQPDVHRLLSPDDLMRIVNGREPDFLTQLQEKSAIIQIPMPTRVFANLIRSSYRYYPDEGETEVGELYRMAFERGITHWCLVDLEGETTTSEVRYYNRGLWAVPWPSDKIIAGYSTLAYPGLLPTTHRPATWDDYTDKLQVGRYAAYLRSSASTSLDYEENFFGYYGEAVPELDAAFGWDFDDSEGEDDLQLNYD